MSDKMGLVNYRPCYFLKRLLTLLLIWKTDINIQPGGENNNTKNSPLLGPSEPLGPPQDKEFQHPHYHSLMYY